ncbi:MAG TPA: DNA repair protein RecN [Thermoanaerobaculia bacterium]|nr:DNA repair protein RecN [Thermoanaerobaculia bacterium]
MITYLKVRNLAIVEEFAIEPGPGLNVLTGETGAGKSLLIDSLEFLSGARGSSDSIRSGADRMSAEAIVQTTAEAKSRFDDLGIDCEADGGSMELIIRREIASNGRGRVSVNGSLLGTRDLASAMESLIEIHGQNESHQRIAGKSFREILDEFAGNEEILQRVRNAWRLWRNVAVELEDLRKAQHELSLRLDLLRYQIQEISEAKPLPDEEEALRAEKAILANAREMIEATAGAFALVEDDEASALSSVARAQHLLQPLAGKIAEIRQLHQELEDIRFRLQEQGRVLAHLADSVRIDPGRLEEIEDRLVVLERMKKKYGGTIEAVLAHLARIREEYDQLSDYETSVEKLERDESLQYQAYHEAAVELSRRRVEAAPRLQQAIEDDLQDLAMENTTVRVFVATASTDGARPTATGRAGPDGLDQVEILIAPNRGEEPKPLQRIASGGELSRIQLAVASALFRHSEKSPGATLVFDEIDAGIGGRVAEAVGKKLRQLARTNQVICVTHLPQIASLGATHFRVWKEEHDGRTRARIERLDERERRIEELARMLGGEVVTPSARAHATELLGRADEQPARKRTGRSTVSTR